MGRTVATKLTESQYKRFLKARKERTNSAFLRQLVLAETERILVEEHAQHGSIELVVNDLAVVRQLLEAIILSSPNATRYLKEHCPNLLEKIIKDEDHD